MALVIAEYQHIVYTSATRPASFPSVTWSAGDVLVIIEGLENNDFAGPLTISTPTVTGLTFGAIAGASLVGTSQQFCEANAYIATAGSGSSGAIACTQTGGTTGYHWGASLWRFTGASSTVGVVGALQSASGSTATERTVTISPTAGSTVVMMLYDFTAAAAGFTGTPTVTTEREDTQDATHYTIWGADWVNVAGGSTAFGISAGTVKATKLAIEIKPAAVAYTPSIVPTMPTRIPA